MHTSSIWTEKIVSIVFRNVCGWVGVHIHIYITTGKEAMNLKEGEQGGWVCGRVWKAETKTGNGVTIFLKEIFKKNMELILTSYIRCFYPKECSTTRLIGQVSIFSMLT